MCKAARHKRLHHCRMHPVVQTRLPDVEAVDRTLASALMHSTFKIANALVAWMGGLVIAYGYDLRVA